MSEASGSPVSMNVVLMRTLADLVLFVAGCGDDVLDPEVSLATLERVSASLRQLQPADLQALSTFLAAEARRTEDPERKAQLRGLLAHLGLEKGRPRRTTRRTGG